MANKGCNLIQLERALKGLDMYIKPEKPIDAPKEKVVESKF